jgi:hypothetical protein
MIYENVYCTPSLLLERSFFAGGTSSGGMGAVFFPQAVTVAMSAPAAKISTVNRKTLIVSPLHVERITFNALRFGTQFFLKRLESRFHALAGRPADLLLPLQRPLHGEHIQGIFFEGRRETP